MCRIVAVSRSSDTSTVSTLKSPSWSSWRSSLPKGMEVARWAAALIVPLYFPPGGLLEEGFTRWWLRLTIFFFLAKCPQKLCNFQAVLGLNINVGWYAVSFYDYAVVGHQFGNIVFRNIRGLRKLTIIGSLTTDQLVFATGYQAVLARVVSILLDTLLHPVLCYYYWRRCRNAGLTLDQVASWSTLLATFLFSRLWSLSQNLKNYNTLDAYYYGYNVYNLPPNSDYLWTIGYGGEAVTITAIILWKLWKRHQINLSTVRVKTS